MKVRAKEKTHRSSCAKALGDHAGDEVLLVERRHGDEQVGLGDARVLQRLGRRDAADDRLDVKSLGPRRRLFADNEDDSVVVHELLGETKRNLVVTCNHDVHEASRLR